MRRIICSSIVFMMAMVLAAVGVKYESGGGPGLGMDSAVIVTLNTGDAKLFKGKIISGTDGHMIIFNQDGTVYCEYTDIPLNWLSVYEPENLVIAASWGNGPLLIELDDDWTVKRKETIPAPKKPDTTLIDPTLIKANDTYILSYVEIEGKINNGDPGTENGVYTVKCMASGNLKDWVSLSDILSCKKNVEDADMVFQDGKLYYFFEKEEYDKGPSSINVIISEDHGQSWQKETELLAAAADQELASVEAAEDGYLLYYSSDIDAPGASYDGAKIYLASFTRDFQLRSTHEVDLGESKGILLYDTKRASEGVYYLYARNYCKENNLVLHIR